MQGSFADLEYAAKKKVTRRDRFLAEIEAVTPWAALLEQIEPHYPKGGGRGRPPRGLERMLRMYIAQQCFGLSDEGVEDALYDSQAIRNFVGIDLSREMAPDATTLLRFRRLLETHGLTERVFSAINTHLAERGLLLREGTVVDATIIAAPSSTKNQKGERDPQMHQTKKGNQWHFGMKAHIGVDAVSGLVHTVVTTAANVNDVTQAHRLLHGKERYALGDAGYQGVEHREEADPKLNGTLPCALACAAAFPTMKGVVCLRPSRNSRPRFGPRWNIRSASSRICSATGRRATRDWPRIPRSS